MADNFAEVQAYVDALVRYFVLRPPVDPGPLRALYDAKRYTALVGHMRDSLSLDIRLRVGYVFSGGPQNAPLWVDVPISIPRYGTEAFRRTTVDMYIRKEFIEGAPFGAVIEGIAHELSHIVLEGLDHPLKRYERAVDLTAMVLGYRHFTPGMEYGSRIVFSDLYSDPRKFFKGVWDELRGSRSQLGYLTREEGEYALKLMERMDAKNKRSASR